MDDVDVFHVDLTQAFNLDAPEQLEEKGIEATVLFGNIGEIIEISDRLLMMLLMMMLLLILLMLLLMLQHQRDHRVQRLVAISVYMLPENV